MIDCRASGLIYRNPKPHLRAAHAWHPSLALLPDGSLLAGFDLGQGPESLDYRTWLSRSGDAGQTWSEPVPLLMDKSLDADSLDMVELVMKFEDQFDTAIPDEQAEKIQTVGQAIDLLREQRKGKRLVRRSTHSLRLSSGPDGSVLAFGGRFYRDDPEEGLINRANGIGYVPMDLIWMQSRDAGRTWDGPRVIEPPLVGPSWETCHRILVLPDGRWLAPTSTWKDWNGAAPNGMKAVALVSHDRGRTWPEYIDVFDQYKQGLASWEHSIAQLPDGRLLAVAWAFEEATGKTYPTPYAISKDGRRFSAPRATGLHGQTAKIAALPDGRVLCLYRRDDKPGLWANLSRLEGEQWVNIEEKVVWSGASGGMTGHASAGEELSSLKFGFPSMALLPSGEILAAFWCREECIYNIRWLRLGV